MKTIFKIHPFFNLLAILSITTGLFRNFIYISILIFIHEIGHITGALIYKWNIKKVIILPFGGITIFNELINKSLKEEFVILVLGPLFQILFYFILCIFKLENSLITTYHYTLLFFNLLPIIPLDGSKLLNIFLNKITSFNKSHLITIYVSILFIIVLLFKNILINNLILYLIILFILLKNIKEIKEHKYMFNKFLFERYMYNLKFKKTKYINKINLKKMKKDHKHMFYDQKYYTEKEILNRYFKIF